MATVERPHCQVQPDALAPAALVVQKGAQFLWFLGNYHDGLRTGVAQVQGAWKTP
jgi:hypothetical protein